MEFVKPKQLHVEVHFKTGKVRTGVFGWRDILRWDKIIPILRVHGWRTWVDGMVL